MWKKLLKWLQKNFSKKPSGRQKFRAFIRYGSFAESSINFNVILRVQTVTDQSLIRHEFIKKIYARYQQVC